jgi:WD40 repeat protein
LEIESKTHKKAIIKGLIRIRRYTPNHPIIIYNKIKMNITSSTTIKQQLQYYLLQQGIRLNDATNIIQVLLMLTNNDIEKLKQLGNLSFHEFEITCQNLIRGRITILSARNAIQLWSSAETFNFNNSNTTSYYNYSNSTSNVLRKSTFAPFTMTKEASHEVKLMDCRPRQLEPFEMTADGNRLLMKATNVKMINVWCVPDCTLLQCLDKHSTEIKCISASPRGDYIASSGRSDGYVDNKHITKDEIFVWNAATLEFDRQLELFGKKCVHLVKFDSTGRFFAYTVEYQPQHLVLREVNGSWPMLYCLEATTIVNSLICLPYPVDENCNFQLIMVGYYNLVSVDVVSGQILSTFEIPKNEIMEANSSIECIIYSPYHHTFIFGYLGGTICIRDLEYKEITKLLQPIVDYSKPFRCLYDLSVTNSVLASGYSDGTVHLWTIPQLIPINILVHSQDSFVYHIMFHPSGEWLLSYGNDSIIKIWKP